MSLPAERADLFSILFFSCPKDGRPSCFLSASPNLPRTPTVRPARLVDAKRRPDVITVDGNRFRRPEETSTLSILFRFASRKTGRPSPTGISDQRKEHTDGLTCISIYLQTSRQSSTRVT